MRSLFYSGSLEGNDLLLSKGDSQDFQPEFTHNVGSLQLS